MPSHRSLRMAEAIREVVATSILFDVADPRVHSVTVVRVEVTGDLRFATVFVSIMGSESERRRSLRGLDHATGFLQARVAARLQTRFTPVLSFRHDDSVRKSVELSPPDRRCCRIGPPQSRTICFSPRGGPGRGSHGRTCGRARGPACGSKDPVAGGRVRFLAFGPAVAVPEAHLIQTLVDKHGITKQDAAPEQHPHASEAAIQAEGRSKCSQAFGVERRRIRDLSRRHNS